MNKSIILLLILTSCSTRYITVSSFKNKEMSELMGKKIMVEGTASNAKLGALLVMDDDSFIWINDLDSWPEGYYHGGDKGEKVRVTGTLIEKYDLPVFIYKEGDPPISGIPVPEGTDLKEASRRYLLKHAKWQIISE